MPFFNCLEDEFHFVLECQLCQDLSTGYKKSTFGISQIYQNVLSYCSQKVKKLSKIWQFTYTKVSKTE